MCVLELIPLRGEKRFKVGFYLKAVFPSRNLGLERISRSRFKQSKNCPFISRIYVLQGKFLGDFWGYLGGESFSQWISEI